MLWCIATCDMQQGRKRTSKKKLFFCIHGFLPLVTVSQKYDVYFGASGLLFFPLTHLKCFLRFLFFVFNSMKMFALFFFYCCAGITSLLSRCKSAFTDGEHMLRISWVSYLRPWLYEKIPSSCCWWPLLIHRHLNTPAHELQGCWGSSTERLNYLSDFCSPGVFTGT